MEDAAGQVKKTIENGLAAGKGVEKHLTIADLAEREGVPESTIYQWNSRGVGPRYMRIGRHVRFRLQDVLAWERGRLTEERIPA